MQKRNIALCLCATAVIAGVSSTAAALPYGTGVPISVPTNNVTITLVFDHTAALFTGNLYFLGSGNATTVLNPAPNTDPTNQGFFVVNKALNFPATGIPFSELNSCLEVVTEHGRTRKPRGQATATHPACSLTTATNIMRVDR